MGAGDVAGAVRARALARRRLGPASARRIAGLPGPDAAVAELATTPYGRYVRRDDTPAEAENGIARTVLWHLRVLAGWQSRSAAAPVRLLAAAFELANLDEHVRRLDGGPAMPPWNLGALAVAWPQLARTGTRAELRAALRRSPWGDPGSDSPWALTVVPRLAWLHRVSARVPEAAEWAYGAALLLQAREQVVARHPLDDPAAAHVRALTGAATLGAVSLTDLVARADRRARWAVAGVDDPQDLWRAEARWWARLDADGLALLHGMRFGGAVAIGCTAVLAADAWRVRAALAAAARDGDTEVLDAVA
ncbi:hypothetical protein [Actinoplanes sp. NPDC049316]|uniref:hypothetical protein n=1 Tax=Actinoplanes sp. NPDC049316 TaxID=3154727 RepID=UPI003446369A